VRRERHTRNVIRRTTEGRSGKKPTRRFEMRRVVAAGRMQHLVSIAAPKLTVKTNRAHLDESVKHYRKARARLDELARGTPGRKPIHEIHAAGNLESVPTAVALRRQIRVSLPGSGTFGTMASQVGTQLFSRSRSSY
jgi:hypothetical protein